jgi:hypothetical protein
MNVRLWRTADMAVSDPSGHPQQLPKDKGRFEAKLGKIAKATVKPATSK